MRVLHVSYSDGGGGASRAAFRIHRALASVENKTGIESHMLVWEAVENDPRVEAISSGRTYAVLGRVARKIARTEKKFLHTENRIIHSTARVPTPTLRRIINSQPDAVLLHWLGNGFLSIKQVGSLSRTGIPIYWVLHDTWAFCGAEHYPNGDADRRFVSGYWSDNRPEWESGLDINRLTWKRKRRYWVRQMGVIAPSRWVGELAGKSALMRDWPVTVIPNPLDVDWWRALGRPEARRQLGIRQDQRVVLFGAMGGESDPRKGGDLLREALERLSRSMDPGIVDDVMVLTFGGRESIVRVGGFAVRSLGRLNDDGLRRVYSAADVMVVPSRMDNLPQTAVEPIVCGTPVVGFRIGGIPEVVTDWNTGRLVEPFSTAELAEAIRWVISNDERRLRLSTAARASGDRWRADSVGFAYARLLAGKGITDSAG